MRTNEVIGFRVIHVDTDSFVHNDPATGANFISHDECAPIPRGDAYRRLAAYLDQHPESEGYEFNVEPVYRQTTPIEDAADELGGLFESLCRRHGLDFGLTRDQINQQLVRDLEAVRDGRGFGPAVVGIPGNGRR